MFADFSKKEFIQTALGGTGLIIVGYLAMLGILMILTQKSSF
jgi:hypothetical protein